MFLGKSYHIKFLGLFFIKNTGKHGYKNPYNREISLHKSRIPKMGGSSGKFIQKKQRNTMNDPFVQRTTEARNKKGKKGSCKKLETRSRKVSEDKRTTLKVVIRRSPAQDEDPAERGFKGNGTRRLTYESTPVEQGQDFATSTGTLDREEMLELSDMSIETQAVEGSPADHTMMQGVSGKAAPTSSFSERVKNTFENFFPFIMGAGYGAEIDTQEKGRK